MELEGKKFFGKVFVVIVVIFVVLGVLIYFGLFSPRLATINRVISLRNSYETQVFNWRKRLGMPTVVNCGPLGIPVRTLKTMNEQGYKYLYSVKGVLVAVDPEAQTMTLMCGKDKEYKVKVAIYKFDNDPGWVKMTGTTYKEDKSVLSNVMMFYPKDLSKSIEYDKAYKDGDIYIV